MRTEKKLCASIIRDLQVGNSVAENDSLLENARVETPVFCGVLSDKYDIVTGRKGAGKTAIFKIINFRKEMLLRERNLVVLAGVNSSGEPIFNAFRDSFKDFSEDDFESLWKLYFIALIYNKFISDDFYEAGLCKCNYEVQDFKSACRNAGFNVPSAKEEKSIFEKIMAKITKISARESISADGSYQLEQSIELKNTSSETFLSQKFLYVNEIGQALRKILEKSGFKLWIILDRLDEVFDRFSESEFNGLRGLLRAYKSFDIGQDVDCFRIKIFLRDDIKQFLTDARDSKTSFGNKKPLVAATHIFSKESPVLMWSQDEIEQLILRRLLSSGELRAYLDFSGELNSLKYSMVANKVNEELKSREKRNSFWNRIFPEKIQSTTSLNWIFTRLKDSNGIVTPRTVIDLLDTAINYQRSRTLVDSDNSLEIFSEESLKCGLDRASNNKLFMDIFNEFPKEQDNILKLKDKRKPKLTKEDMSQIYGDSWLSVVESLCGIGILRYVERSETYIIEFLFRSALNIPYKY